MPHIVFFVHGIGRHADGVLGQATASAWATDVKESLLKAARTYPAFDESAWVLEPILYDDVFFTHVTRWDALADALSGTPFAPMTDWMKGAAEPGFLWDAIGDVILYRAFDDVRQHVITSVAKQFVAAVNKHGAGADYSIVAHSLGSAVAHDVVQKLATVAIDGNKVMQPPNFRFRNFFALANVSRLVWATDAAFYQDTRVRPRDSGLLAERCAVEYYANFRHVADPVPSVVRFASKGWSAELSVNVELEHLHSTDVHAYTHYLLHPKCSDLILSRVLGRTMIPIAQHRARILAFKDHEGADAEKKKLAVSAMRGVLDAVSAQSAGNFDQAIRAIGDLLAKYKSDFDGLFE